MITWKLRQVEVELGDEYFPLKVTEVLWTISARKKEVVLTYLYIHRLIPLFMSCLIMGRMVVGLSFHPTPLLIQITNTNSLDMKIEQTLC